MQPPEDMSKEQLINDLVNLRHRIDELEKIKDETQNHCDELIQTKAMFEGLFEFAPDAILVISSKGDIIQVNQQAEMLFGYTRKELVGADHDIVVPDRFRGKHLVDRTEYMSAPHVRHMGTGLELYGRRKDGSEFPVDIALGPLQARDEVVTLAVVRDFTERKQALDKIASLAAFVEFSTDAIIGQTLEGIIVSWNPGAEITYGYTAKEVIGRSISLLSPPGHPEDMITIFEQVRRGEALKHYESVHRRKDGTLIHFSSSVSPFKDSVGNIVGVVTIARDVTEQKRVEEALKEQRQQLEDANRELESFSYSISHDLKAPLRAIDGFSRMFMKKYGNTLDEEAARMINVIYSNAKKMGTLIDDLLSFSKVLSNSMTISEIDMNKLAGEVCNEIRVANEEREFEIRIAKLEPGYGDEALIRQVLFNLISNAIKFTKDRKPGIISISSYCNADKIIFCLQDNGAGFDMAYYDKLFGVFQRLHRQEEYEGTGVGLAIVQRIVKRHGGDVWAEGKVNEGATFHFSLPNPDKRDK